MNSLKDNDSTLTTVINGVSIEIVGVGFFLPLAPSSPIYFDPDTFYHNEANVDSIKLDCGIKMKKEVYR